MTRPRLAYTVAPAAGRARVPGLFAGAAAHERTAARGPPRRIAGSSPVPYHGRGATTPWCLNVRARIRTRTGCGAPTTRIPFWRSPDTPRSNPVPYVRVLGVITTRPFDSTFQTFSDRVRDGEGWVVHKNDCPCLPPTPRQALSQTRPAVIVYSIKSTASRLPKR